MNISSRPGDKGFTANLNGDKISKNSPLIHLIGTLDELNSYLGLIKIKVKDDNDKRFLEKVQINLSKLMAYLSDSSNIKYSFTANETAELENEINKLKAEVPKQFNLVIPGKNETEAFIHIARTVARRAERWYVSVCETTGLSLYGTSFLNRLSSYLFELSLKD